MDCLFCVVHTLHTWTCGIFFLFEQQQRCSNSRDHLGSLDTLARKRGTDCLSILESGLSLPLLLRGGCASGGDGVGVAVGVRRRRLGAPLGAPVLLLLLALHLLGVVRRQVRLGADHHPELLVVDLPVAVFVNRLDHLVDLLVRHLAREVGQDELELVRRYAAWNG